LNRRGVENGNHMTARVLMDRFLAHVDAQRAKIRRQIARLEDELGKLDYSDGFIVRAALQWSCLPLRRPVLTAKR